MELDLSDDGLTDGRLLDGAIRYAQPKIGYRTGVEPVFLAAAVPARPGQRVLEAGTGAGAGLLCLTWRVAGLSGLGVEIEPGMARIAAMNFARNDRSQLAVLTGDILALTPASAGIGAPFDHAMANPPWHSDASSLPDGGLKRSAKVATPQLAARWIAAMAALLRPRGTLTLIVPPRAVPESLSAFASCGCGSPLLVPLWPRAGREPRIVLLQAIKGGRGDFRLLPGLTLHEEAGYTQAADAILRRGHPLPLG